MTQKVSFHYKVYLSEVKFQFLVIDVDYQLDKLSENLTLTENQIALTENQIDEIKDLAKKFRKKREEIKDFHNKKLHEIEKTTRLVETKTLDIRENLKNFHSQLKSLKNEASFKQEEDSKENISNVLKIPIIFSAHMKLLICICRPLIQVGIIISTISLLLMIFLLKKCNLPLRNSICQETELLKTR